MSSGLFGINHSNRKENDHWGKNCFNSSFPTATACYMLAHKTPAIYIYLDNVGGELCIKSGQITIEEVFNCSNQNLNDLYFSFESIFEPYQQYSFEEIDGIDLVVKNTKGEYLSPLEVKLTVLPTDSTSKQAEEKWGCELVIRSATTSYCALGMFDSIKHTGNPNEIRNIFEQSCSNIQMWNNDYEVNHKMTQLFCSINTFQKKFYHLQKPLLMQTIWKTRGKSPLLAEQAFDIVIWSDYAFSRLFIDDSCKKTDNVSRPKRATARLARCLWELSKSGKIRITDIYRQMAFGTQTDKEFAIGGSKWRNYVRSERILRPQLNQSVIHEIIEKGYIEKLSPERRFDQTLYFTMKK